MQLHADLQLAFPTSYDARIALISRRQQLDRRLVIDKGHDLLIFQAVRVQKELPFRNIELRKKGGQIQTQEYSNSIRKIAALSYFFFHTSPLPLTESFQAACCKKPPYRWLPYGGKAQSFFLNTKNLLII